MTMSDDVWAMLDRIKASAPKVPLDHYAIRGEQEKAALWEHVERAKPDELYALPQASPLWGTPIVFDPDVPPGVLRACYANGTAVDTPIR